MKVKLKLPVPEADKRDRQLEFIEQILTLLSGNLKEAPSDLELEWVRDD
jgi:hypothetical protein